jgi:3-oxoacyl-[acyl-carrier protein] reductase
MSEAHMKAIIVTGGTRGIGRAIVDGVAARLLAKDPDIDGARLVVTYKSQSSTAESLIDGLRAQGVPAEAVPLDLASSDSIETFVKRVHHSFGAVRALINNAGTTLDGSFLSMPDDAVSGLIGSNLGGTIHLTELLLPLLKESNPATVVFMASAAGIYGKAGQVPYATTKGGLIGYTQLLARRVRKQNIFVNAVAPGFIATEMVAGLAPKMYEPTLNSTSLGSMGAPADVAHVVCGLFRPGYVQAATLKVDGGFLR